MLEHFVDGQHLVCAGCFSLYVQLPTAAAHEYHMDPVVDVTTETATATESRLHPSVSKKIREIISGGELRQYYIRQLLRLSLVFCLFRHLY